MTAQVSTTAGSQGPCVVDCRADRLPPFPAARYTPRPGGWAPAPRPLIRGPLSLLGSPFQRCRNGRRAETLSERTAIRIQGPAFERVPPPNRTIGQPYVVVRRHATLFPKTGKRFWSQADSLGGLSDANEVFGWWAVVTNGHELLTVAFQQEAQQGVVRLGAVTSFACRNEIRRIVGSTQGPSVDMVGCLGRAHAIRAEEGCRSYSESRPVAFAQASMVGQEGSVR